MMPTLNWIGKEKIVNHHRDVPYCVLDRKYSFDKDGQHEEDNGSENMIIHGDNLYALKALLPKYEGKIKCIYIDPPYNTGNENWVYNDNVNDPQIKRWLGEVVGKEGEDMTRHDKWLCMMYPRLQLLRRLLSENGVIFISIGEDEHANLKLVCDELFGSRNYVTDFCRQMKSGGAKGHYYTPSLDYILTYAKNIDALPYFRTVLTQQQIDTFYKFIEKQGPKTGEKYGEERLFKSSLEPRANQRYYIRCPDGTFAIPPGENFPQELVEGLTVMPSKTDKVWKWIYPRYQSELENGNIVFKKTTTSGLIDENGLQSKWNIYNKLWLSEQQEKGVVPSNIITEFENRQSASELKKLELKFEYSKPLNLIKYLISISQQSNDAIVLDSFAGSATTAQAVLELNKNDGGNRKVILVEMMEYAETITAERVKKVINGYADESGIDSSFSYYELGEQLLTDEHMLNEDIDIQKIREYIWFIETKTPFIGVDSNNPYLLGKVFETSYYFYYEKGQETILNESFLNSISKDSEGYVIYADACTLPKSLMSKMNIIFKKIPRDISKL